jgi:hypothetical protein
VTFAILRMTAPLRDNQIQNMRVVQEVYGLFAHDAKLRGEQRVNASTFKKWSMRDFTIIIPGPLRSWADIYNVPSYRSSVNQTRTVSGWFEPTIASRTATLQARIQLRAQFFACLVIMQAQWRP